MQIDSPQGGHDDPAEADTSAEVSPYSRRSVQLWLVVVSLICCGGLLWQCCRTLRGNAMRESKPAEDHSPSRLVVDLNSASAKELSLLPGVGPVLATRIVNNRQQEGPFDSIEELDRVDGIGPSKLEQLRDWCVTPAETTAVIRSARRP